MLTSYTVSFSIPIKALTDFFFTLLFIHSSIPPCPPTPWASASSNDPLGRQAYKGYTHPTTPPGSLAKISPSEAVLETQLLFWLMQHSSVYCGQLGPPCMCSSTRIQSEIYIPLRDFSPRWRLDLNADLILNCHNVAASGGSYYYDTILFYINS